ncbi:hypothetical protein [Microbulbifer epialgicus]|uniref:Uncharacterized protein n=1 Tax=Microbulbifer epialgicus TaxID=393907 RepID=A0ABV4NTT7_9GAMM
MTKPFIATGMIQAALIKAGMPPRSIELRDPDLRDDDSENPDIIRLVDDYYLAIEVNHPETPMEFSVTLNESMYSGGDVLSGSWVVDGMLAESLLPVIEAVKSL